MPNETTKGADLSAADLARQRLEADPAAYIREHTVKGHAYESHVGVSQVTLLDNVVSGQKQGDTAYSDAETEIRCTSEMIYANMQKIMEFAGGTSRYKGTRLTLRSAFTDPDTDDPLEIGTGYLSEAWGKENVLRDGCGVVHISCSCASVVIEKNPDAPGGWEILTSFPMAYPPDYMPQPCRINDDFTKTLRETRTYAISDPVTKTYMDYACSGKRRNPGISVKYMPDDGTYPAAIRLQDGKGHTKFVRPDAPPPGFRPPGAPRPGGIDGLVDYMSRQVNYHRRHDRFRAEEIIRQAEGLVPDAAPGNGLGFQAEKG